jgi:uncharacterized protein YacL
LIVRIVFIIIAVAVSYVLNMKQPMFWLYPLIVLVVSGGIVGFETWVKSFQKENVTKLFKGFIIGLVLGAAFSAIVRSFGVEITPFLRVIIYLCMIYLGVALFSQLEIGLGFSQTPARKGAAPESLKILDTSVIIDGRIADIIETKFIEGLLVVPKFVLDELQLNRLRKKKDILLRITDKDFPEIPDVDSKLVKLAKTLDAKVITNDFNLLKVAEIQDVEVLNINLLTNALKPVVLPGEKMKLVVIKEGKDPGQGIGYLDDGTMVVVDSGKRWVGEKIEVTVTSVLQTPAGRMIFAKYEGE